MSSLSLKIDNCGFSKDVVEETAKSLFPYIEELKNRKQDFSYSFKEDFINLPYDKNLFEECQKLAEAKKDTEEIILIGIGGSNLGTEAVYEALKNQKKEIKEILFAETVDSLTIKTILEKAGSQIEKGKKILMVLISKSGTTTETISNFGAIVQFLKDKGFLWEENTVVITDEDSKLSQYAKEQNIETLFVPKLVGGRFSVFSQVGMFPLALSGISVEELAEGGRKATQRCLTPNIEENPALKSAVSLFLNYKEERSIFNTFLFCSCLYGFGRWRRQLIGESLGKDGKGITPILSIGSTDLHSTAQLYFDGPRDKFTEFFSVKETDNDFKVSRDIRLNSLVSDIEGKSLNQIMKAIFEGVKTAYQKSSLPFIETELGSISEGSIGELLQTKMFEVIYLAKLMGVNAFNQPAVELYKLETRKILRS